jgi:hypothetical protein
MFLVLHQEWQSALVVALLVTSSALPSVFRCVCFDLWMTYVSGFNNRHQVAAVMNCADNTGAKNLFILSVKGIKVWLCVSQYQRGTRPLIAGSTGSLE